jgi:hypothetical protein
MAVLLGGHFLFVTGGHLQLFHKYCVIAEYRLNQRQLAPVNKAVIFEYK